MGVATVEFLCKRKSERAHLSNRQKREDPLDKITQAMEKAMGLQLTGTFTPCKVCVLGKAKNAWVSKMAVPCLMVEGKRLFIDTSSLSPASMGSKEHWLHIVKDSTDYGWSYFLKRNLSLRTLLKT